MSLRNLLGTSLEQITPDRDSVRRLLEAAKRQIADAKVAAVSVALEWLRKNAPDLL